MADEVLKREVIPDNATVITSPADKIQAMAAGGNTRAALEAASLFNPVDKGSGFQDYNLDTDKFKTAQAAPDSKIRTGDSTQISREPAPQAVVVENGNLRDYQYPKTEQAPTTPGTTKTSPEAAQARQAELKKIQESRGLSIPEAQELKKLNTQGEKGTPPPTQTDQRRYNAIHEKAVVRGQQLTPDEASFAADFESTGRGQQDVVLEPWQQRREELIAMEAKVNNGGGELNTARKNELDDLDNREKVRLVREKEARGDTLTDEDRKVKEGLESQVVAKEREEKIESKLAELRDRIATGDIKDGEAMEQLQEIRNLVGGPELKAIKPGMMKEAVRRAMSEAQTTEQQKRTQEIIQEMMSIEAALLILPQQGKALMEKRDEVDGEIDDTERDMEHLDPNNPEDAQKRLKYYDLFMQRVNVNAQILQVKYGATRMLAQIDVLQNQLDTATGRQGLLGHIGGAVVAYSRRWAHNAVFNLKASRERNPKI